MLASGRPKSVDKQPHRVSWSNDPVVIVPPTPTPTMAEVRYQVVNQGSGQSDLYTRPSLKDKEGSRLRAPAPAKPPRAKTPPRANGLSPPELPPRNTPTPSPRGSVQMHLDLDAKGRGPSTEVDNSKKLLSPLGLIQEG